MGADDWYRSAGWSANAQALFERKLARAALHNKPQYLLIKGLALLEADDPRLQDLGQGLMRRVVSEYPDSTFDVSIALDTVLADDPVFGDLQFRYAVARARLADLTDEPDQAAAFAIGAQRRLKDGLGRALATLARDEHFDALAALLCDPAHGRYRVYLLWALEHVKHPDAVDLAIDLLDDDDLHLDALRTLGDLRSERAETVFTPFAMQPKPRGRGNEAERTRTQIAVAQRGLEKLEAARAKGKSRP